MSPSLAQELPDSHLRCHALPPPLREHWCGEGGEVGQFKEETGVRGVEKRQN